MCHYESVFPILYVDKDGKEAVEGNGFIVRCNERFFFVTCHHVLDGYPKDLFVIINEKRLNLEKHNPSYKGINIPVNGYGPDNQAIRDFGVMELQDFQGDFLELSDSMHITTEDEYVLITHRVDSKQVHIQCKIFDTSHEFKVNVLGKVIAVQGGYVLRELVHNDIRISGGDSGSPIVLPGTNVCIGMVKGNMRIEVVRGHSRDMPVIVGAESVVSFIKCE